MLDLPTNDLSKDSQKQLDEPVQGKEVFAPVNEPFEKPAETFVAGEFYKSAEEVMPELSADAVSEVGPVEGALALPVDRRDFMRLFSASTMVASVSASCLRRPAEKAVPYVNQPIDQIPGVPTYFASTCGECASGCGVVVKTREGRPVKIEGSPEHPISQGGTCALGQSTLQALYHPERRKKPLIIRGQRVDSADWEEVYEVLGSKLKKATNVGILTGGSTGHRHEFMRTWLKQIGSKESNLYTYDSNSLISSTAAANKIAFGAEGMPRVDFLATQMIVGVGSDFLEIGLSSTYSAKGFSMSHGFRNGRMGTFVQFESGLSQTGARASERHVIPVGSETAVVLLIADALLKKGASKGSSSERAEIQKILNSQKSFLEESLKSLNIAPAVFDSLADELLKQKSVILAGGSGSFDENSTMLQLAAIMANVLVGAYGERQPLRLDEGWMISAVVPGDVKRFREEAAKLDVLFIIDSNPAFTMPGSFEIEKLLKGIPTVVSIQTMPNETDNLAQFILPNHHYLESWGDEQPVAGFWSARQPAVRPVTDSRQAEDSLLWLAAAAGKPMKYREYREYLMDRWQQVFDLIKPNVDFGTFFKAVLRRGFVGKLSKRSLRDFGSISGEFKVTPIGGGLRLVAPLDVRLRDGHGADRPILQEVGDSLTTITWDSWVSLNPNTAKKLGFKTGDVLSIESQGGTIEAALYPLPGLHPDAVYVPRGNGHESGLSRVCDGRGVNPLKAFAKAEDSFTGDAVTAGQSAKIKFTGKRYRLAMMQKHSDIGNRKDIIKKVGLAAATAGVGKTLNLDDVPDLYPDLYAKDRNVNYRWGMAVDLTLCTGCSACMVACSTENNIPQVGREQILHGREMHWIRLDRYFAGSVDNPEVTFQPVMCQHCNHAPCEAVCPVFATTHEPEGLNAQTYNRCVGTRYCANACPYKVRRFNWFTFKWNVIGKEERDRNPRALNPEVTVRTRGIMEKCTMCVQRIRDGKHRAAEREGKVRDGEIKTACQQVCPSNALVFGDLMDPNSEVSRARKDNRAYLLLGGEPDHHEYGIKTLPNVSYLKKVTIKETADAGGGHGANHDTHHG